MNTITNIGQCRDRMEIEITFVNDTTRIPAIVHVPRIDPLTGSDDVRCVWLCYDTEKEEYMGTLSPEMFGRKASWFIPGSETGELILSGCITLYRPSVPGRKLLRDRVTLIRCLAKALPKAEDLGVGDVLARIIRRIRRDENGHFLSYSQEHPDKVSYAASPEHRFSNASRTYTTLGRYIRRSLGVSAEELSDDNLMHVTRDVFAHLDVVRYGDMNDRVQTFTGDKIVEVYREGVGYPTCITGNRADVTKVFAANPDKCSVLIYRSSDGKQSRALLWTLDDGRKFLDRIYPNDGAHVNELVLWAGRNGILTRNDQFAQPSAIDKIGHPEHLTVTVKHAETGLIPYLDTFRWGLLIDDGRVVLSNHRTRVRAEFNGKVCESDIHTEFAAPSGAYVIPACRYCGVKPSCHRVITYADGRVACPDCDTRHNMPCPACGGKMGGVSVHVHDTGQDICPGCAAEATVTCAHCLRVLSREGVRDVRIGDAGTKLCPECLALLYEKCDVCGTYVQRGHAKPHGRNGRICGDCERKAARNAKAAEKRAETARKRNVDAGEEKIPSAATRGGKPVARRRVKRVAQA